MEQNVNMLSVSRNPDPVLVELATWEQYGIMVLLLCLLIYVGLIFFFLKRLKQHHPTLWQSAGRPTLLSNNRGLFGLLFGKLSKDLPREAANMAKMLRYLTYIIVLLIIMLAIVFNFIN